MEERYRFRHGQLVELVSLATGSEEADFERLWGTVGSMCPQARAEVLCLAAFVLAGEVVS